MELSLKKRKRKSGGSNGLVAVISFVVLVAQLSYANKIRHNTPDGGLKPYQRRTRTIEDLLGEN